MDVILLERIGRLGQMGETVKVKDGYARNFLLPQARLFVPTKPTRRSSKASALARSPELGTQERSKRRR